ncbi:Protein of unknown function [Bacillus wiedmannii]|nr:Protein of unknown function [Bacillus wiedmannii]
MKNPQA